MRGEVNPDPITEFLTGSNTGINSIAHALAIIDHPIEFAEALRKAGFPIETMTSKPGRKIVYFDPPEPPHVHGEWRKAGEVAGGVKWRCGRYGCPGGVTAYWTTYAPVPES